MPTVHVCALPSGALLDRYVGTGAYTDCFCIHVDRPASLPEFIEAFYTTPLFKLERLLLSLTPAHRSTDDQARELASGSRKDFAAWSVQARQSDQIMLAAGRTRSWLMVRTPENKPGEGRLFFGSAVVPRRAGDLGWQFTALLGFHRLYSRLLLGAAARRLARRPV